MAETTYEGSKGRRRRDGSLSKDNTKHPPSISVDLNAGKEEFRPQLPARYCAPCRGPHDPAKATSSWDPYTLKQRMSGLRILETHFYEAARTGCLPVKLDGDKPNRVVWTLRSPDGAILTPALMSQEQYIEFLPLLLEGCREQHESYHFLAFEAAKGMIDEGCSKMVMCVPHLIRPMTFGLQTMEPNLVATQIFLLQRMIKSNRWMAVAFVPYLKKILPNMSIFKYRHDLAVQVPPPMCTAATGSRSGRGPAPDVRACNVCGKFIDPEAMHARAKAAAMANGFEPPKQNIHTRSKSFKAVSCRRPFQRFVMSELIMDTLNLIEESAGKEALQEIRKFVPSWGMSSRASTSLAG